MFTKPMSIPMGRSIFFTWPQIDRAFNDWAKSYFGEHVCGEGERDETDCYISLRGLRVSDEAQFSSLFDKYDKDQDYDPSAEFYTGEQASCLPDCVTRGIMSEVFRDFDLKSIGKVIAIRDGVFFMENELDYSKFVTGRYYSSAQDEKISLKDQIQSAGSRTSGSRLTSPVPAKQPEPER